MTKLLAVTPIILLLTACATISPTENISNSKSTFTCEDGGKVMTAYSNDGQVANLNIRLPKIGLNNKNVTLNQAVSGSGARYTNDSDPNMSYEWHTKSDYGIISISKKDGQDYSVNCEL
ncbi:MliC family protein [Psychrobacter faecalis]|uniref:MliC family protein n=1 Tax=Psychrobacter faecalis TaxID=180588 RepID=UPI0019180911|nr:MliC family protein [Psychrobacter faecalis]